MNKNVLTGFLPLNVRVTKEMIEFCREVLSLSNRWFLRPYAPVIHQNKKTASAQQRLLSWTKCCMLPAHLLAS
jgi:hypothetical protein